MTGVGRFITLEGGEGAGKSTQARLLAETLAGWGLPVLCTREPGGSPGAERLRGLLLSGEIDWSPQAETLLHFAARAEHVAKTIRPALAVGTWVVCDRFYDSTMAYQGHGQGADRHLIRAQIELLGIRPDLTLVLDVSDRVAKQRLSLRGGDADRYEREDRAFHTRVNDAFRAIAAAEPDRCRVIRADGTETEVREAILRAIRTAFAADLPPAS